MAIRYVSVNGYNEHELVHAVWQEHVQAGLRDYARQRC